MTVTESTHHHEAVGEGAVDLDALLFVDVEVGHLSVEDKTVLHSGDDEQLVHVGRQLATPLLGLQHLIQLGKRRDDRVGIRGPYLLIDGREV